MPQSLCPILWTILSLLAPFLFFFCLPTLTPSTVFLHVDNGYSLRLKKTIVVDSQTSCLIIHLIRTFCINIVYFDMTYLIIRDTLIMIYLF